MTSSVQAYALCHSSLSPLTVISFFLSFAQQGHNTCSFSGTELAYLFIENRIQSQRFETGRKVKKMVDYALFLCIFASSPPVIDDGEDDDDG